MICLILQIFSGIVFLFTACVLVEGASTLFNKKDHVGCLLVLVVIIILTIIGVGLLTIF